MEIGKVVSRTIVPVAIALGLCACASVAFADVEAYEPTVPGNSAYTNQVDPTNGYGVDGIYFTAQIAEQNAASADTAKGASATVGTSSEDTSPICVTNSTGKAISEFSVKTQDETTFPSNMMSGTLADGDTAGWNFTYTYKEVKYTNAIGVTINEPVNYTIQVKFSDGSMGVFHNLNMNGVRTINLCYSDTYAVYYAERTTITNHTPDPNLYYEVNMSTAADPAELDYHVNSAGGMGARMITAARGGGWEVSDHSPSQTIADFGIELPLYGTPTGDYTDGVYDELHWNSDTLPWRDYNNA